MYATTFFTMESEGVEIAGDFRSRLEWCIARRARELLDHDPEVSEHDAWAQAEAEIIGRFAEALQSA